MSDWRNRLAPDGIRNRLRELEQSEPEVRLLRLLLGEDRMLAWALSIGALRYPGLWSSAPPLPPDALRGITAEASPELFLWTGIVDAETVLRLAHEHGSRGERQRPRLLDFGCGCGRVLRFLLGHADLFELYGTDVNPDHVRWCRRFLAPVAFASNGPRPPLSYPDGCFDLIWGLSVFTHLGDTASAEWRAELARVLAPGGLLVLTLHGEAALAKIESDPTLAAMSELDDARLDDVRREVSARGFAFVPYRGAVLAAAQAGESYGLSFASPDHVGRIWPDERLELVTHLPGGLRGWQDIVVLRRRAPVGAVRGASAANPASSLA